jgi:hypothetical protein
MSLSNELKELSALHQSGALTDTEFEVAKKRLLSFEETHPTRVDRDAQTEPNAPKDQEPPLRAHYMHPDPKVNTAIQAVFKRGSLEAAGLTLRDFKKQLKEASYPHAKKVKTKTARIASRLFVPGEVTEIEAYRLDNEVLWCLSLYEKLFAYFMGVFIIVGWLPLLMFLIHPKRRELFGLWFLGLLTLVGVILFILALVGL